MFDALYLRLPGTSRRVVPNVAKGMPGSSADFKTFTVKVRPGIYFADDPAFGGKRKLTAHDFVYTYKRILIPRIRVPSFRTWRNLSL